MNRGRFKQTATVAEAKRSKGPPTAAGLKITADVPDMPGELSPAARAEWDRIVGGLVAEDRLTKLDRWLLATYCEMWSLWVRSTAAFFLLDLSNTLLWGTDANGKPLPNTDCMILLDLSGNLIDQASTFGMTARTRHLDHHDRGRPKKPLEEHVLKGDPSRLMRNRKRREVEELIKQQRDDDSLVDQTPPEGLPAEALDEWRHMVSQLAAHDLYCPLDRGPLAAGCVAWSIFRIAEKQMRDQPLKLPNGDTRREVKHPLLVMMDSSWQLINTVAKEFAMGPLWRKRWKSSLVPGNIPRHLRVFIGSRSTA